MDRTRVRRLSGIAAAAAFSLMALVACGENARIADEVAKEVTRVPVASEAAVQATKDAASGATPGAGGEAPAGDVAATVEIVAHDIFFEPKEITIPADTNVKVVLPNQGAAAHNFTIEKLGISVDLAPGETKDVIINAPAGEYAFDCTVPGHKEAGMVGTLIVSAEATAATEASPAAAEATPAVAEQAAEAPATAEATAATEAAPAATADTVEVVSHDIFFDPKELTIPANTDVTVKLPNEGVTPHDFSIDALGISVAIAPGETKEVVINAAPGTYEYYCNVPGHKAAGMFGTLTVTAEGAATTEAAPAAAASPATDAAAPATEAAPATDASPAAAEQAAAPAATADTVEVVSHDIFFDPKEITIPANTDVTVKLPNEGVTPHDFSIDELGISVAINPGETKEVVINAAPGTYEFYCNVPGHKAAGMFGTLTVTAEGGATTEAASAAQTADASPASEAAPATAAAEASPAAAEGAAPAAAEPVEVVSHDIFFDPKELTIPANTDVTVKLPNEGVTPHDFSIDALGISVAIAPGQTEEVVINAAPGTYEYYCNVPGHKAAGMFGTLTVK